MDEIFIVETNLDNDGASIENLWQTLEDADNYITVKVKSMDKKITRDSTKEDDVTLRFYTLENGSISVKKMHVN